ncbi:MAG: hypothetical protein Kow0074_24210 [Candidatus Zixiibacteriota bacterium]
MNASPIAIVGVGMATPIGLNAAETAASARSRTVRLTQIEWRDGRFQPYTVGIVPDNYLPPLSGELATQPLPYRQARMIRLAHGPVQEALSTLPKSVESLPLVLGLAELETTIPISAAALIQQLVVQTGAPIEVRRSRFIAQGRASALLALDHGVQLLRAGKTTFVLVGGLDSHIDLYILGTLDRLQRIRNDVNSDGFAPGEGAGFVLLTTLQNAQAHDLPVLAIVKAVAMGQEPGHLEAREPYKGEGLANTFKRLFASLPGEQPVACVYSTFNGETYWAKELGVARVRNQQRFSPAYQMEHPAECFGDLGAAHGAVMLGLAALGIRDGYRASPALVYASSDLGARAAAFVSRN